MIDQGLVAIRNFVKCVCVRSCSCSGCDTCLTCMITCQGPRTVCYVCAANLIYSQSNARRMRNETAWHPRSNAREPHHCCLSAPALNLPQRSTAACLHRQGAAAGSTWATRPQSCHTSYRSTEQFMSQQPSLLSASAQPTCHQPLPQPHPHAAMHPPHSALTRGWPRAETEAEQPPAPAAAAPALRRPAACCCHPRLQTALTPRGC
jgi:hypothetical protein